MSITAVQGRVAQLESLIAQASSPGAGNFAAAMASASGSTGAGAAALASPVGAGTTTTAGAPAAAPSSSAAASTGATPAGVSALPAGTPYGAEITAAAKRHGLDPALLAGLIKQESGFNPNARSGAGAVGLTQLMPATAAGLGVTDPTDPAQSIEGGAKYLADQLGHFGGDVARALAAYNAGPGAVERFGGVPPYAETQDYVRAVQANAAQFRAKRPSTPIPSTV